MEHKWLKYFPYAKPRIQQVEAIENRQVELEGEYEEVQQTERDLVQKLNEKYGPGQLDPQSGVFTPVPPQEAPQG